MAFWTNLLNSLFLPGKPILGSTGMALRDNIIAMGEGAPGAQRVHPAALGTYRGMVTISGATPQQFLGLDRFAAIRADYIVTSVAVSTVVDLEVGYSADGGATWGGYQVIAPGPTNSTTAANERGAFGMFRLDLVTGAWVSRAVRAGSNTSANLVSSSGTHTVPANCNAIRFRFSANVGNTGNVEIVGLSGVS